MQLKCAAKTFQNSDISSHGHGHRPKSPQAN